MLLEALGPILSWRFDRLSVAERWWAILNARDGKNFIRTGFPRSELRFKKVSRAFSSGGFRYSWPSDFAASERRPFARCCKVETGTLLRFEIG